MRLIDVLNKIANGELKEGTRLVWDDKVYTFDGNEDLTRIDTNSVPYDLWEDIYIGNLNEECELLEPEEPKECEHEWEEYGMYNTKTKEDKHFRKCIKCDLEEEIEPTDNTKIEELDKEEMLCLTLQCAIAVLTDKLNELISKVNKENNNE